MMPFAEVSRAVGYQFADRTLLAQALTHRSAAAHHNERLEFLGDSVLNFCVAERLYRAFPAAAEGELSRMRALLVREATLARVARDLHLGDAMRLGAGAVRSGGHDRDSILADALEAVIGAIHLDGGFEAAAQAVGALLAGRIAALDPTAVSKDPKTRLQEFLQAADRPLPVYEVVEMRGPDHARSFAVRCSLTQPEQAFAGQGASRRKAEQAAAACACKAIQHAGGQ